MKRTLAALTVFALAATHTYAQSAAPLTYFDQQKPSEVLGSDFIGTSVLTKNGDRIGVVSNLVFDQTGHIELAVIGIGGFLGVGEKEIAVPFDSLKSDVQNNKHVLLIEATKDDLKAAPTYQTLNDKALQERVALWRQKASEGWSKVKERANEAAEKAGEAYQQAKKSVNDMRSDASTEKQ
jgi:sporulation protein YlmC with PRC-barrel domain